MSYTLTETGKVLTETQEGITMPADYSFATVNDYVHGVEVSFEDLVALCLGMACEIDKLRILIADAADDIEAWGAYASEYFQQKHDLAGNVAKYREAEE